MDGFDKRTTIVFDFLGRNTPDLFETITDVAEFAGFGSRPECNTLEFVEQ